MFIFFNFINISLSIIQNFTILQNLQASYYQNVYIKNFFIQISFFKFTLYDYTIAVYTNIREDDMINLVNLLSQREKLKKTEMPRWILAKISTSMLAVRGASTIQYQTTKSNGRRMRLKGIKRITVSEARNYFLHLF